MDGNISGAANGARGDFFVLERTDSRHFAGKHDAVAAEAGRVSFQDSLLGSLNEVNDFQMQHETLSVQSVINPDSVDPHDLTIASAQANLSLNITKNVIDRVIQAYREISNLR